MLKLDARTLEVKTKYQAIYSNHHLSDQELRASFVRQREIVDPGGYLVHSLAHGNHEEVIAGLLIKERTAADIRRLASTPSA
jgi:hypothetical protein